VGGLAVDVVPFFLERCEQVIAPADRHWIPTIYDERLFATAGGLLYEPIGRPNPPRKKWLEGE
jgi:hypothetical protein